MMITSSDLLAKLRTDQPLVHCITNYVAMNIAANVVLAAGASPAMVHSSAETREFVAISGALTVNIGTLSPDWLSGMREAAEAANAIGKPWVLDPVAHFATRFRRAAVAELLSLRPTIIRANASEIIALAGGSMSGRGVDSGDAVSLAEAAATDLARVHGAVVAVTGEVDFVTDGARAVRIRGGSPLMPRVTALGCSLTCLVGAFVAVAPTQPFEAAIAALTMFSIAGERAHPKSEGPGSFAWQFLDALAQVSPSDLESAARVEAL